MSKKTKKEKIIADFRKRQQALSFFKNPTSSSTISLEKNFSEDESKEKISQVQNDSLYIYPVHLIKKDLTKTALLCILAISLELALFLILEKGLPLPFKI